MISNDPLVTNQWFLHNFGQTGGPSNLDLDIQAAWQHNHGQNVVVGFVADGIQHDHPDLRDRFAPWLSHHFANQSSNTWAKDDHDTALAGLVVATANNGIGVAGIAPQASFATLGINTSDLGNDWVISQALSHKRNEIDIYNSSWGPWDSGEGLDRPGELTEKALADGVKYGRNGLGNIFVWSAGNGLEFNDNTNYDGYVSSRYTIAVTGINHRGHQAYYSEPGASIFVAAYSSGDFQGLMTTVSQKGNGDPLDGYAESGMTSGAAPVVSGVAALILGTNPSLGWRDVQHILASTATKTNPGDSDWTTNGAGYHINHKYGFGAVNAGAAVTAAATWQNVGPEVSFVSQEQGIHQAVPDNNSWGISSKISVTQDIKVESAEILFDAVHGNRGELDVRLISPDGTESILAERHNDPAPDYDRWTFTSIRNWGESSLGDWTLRVSDRVQGEVGQWNSWQLNLYGSAGQGGNPVPPVTPPPVTPPVTPPPVTPPPVTPPSTPVPSTEVLGTAASEYVPGGAGAEHLIGGAGSDYVWAGPGDDRIDGSNASLKGANEWDILVGGDGADTFVLGDSTQAYYSAAGHSDLGYVEDFQPGTDLVVLYGSADNYRLEHTSGESWLSLRSGESVAGFASATALKLSDFQYLG